MKTNKLHLQLFLSTILILFILPISSAQNLVPNPGFEDATPCPTDHGQVNYALPWFNPNTHTPDYMHTCIGQTDCGGSPPYVCIPSNWAGEAFPNTGEGYCGVFSGGGNDAREYISVPLDATLVAGETYLVSFYISCADNYTRALDRMGIVLTVEEPNSNNQLDYVPDFETPPGEFISNKDSWVQYSGEIVADGGEQYLTLGNFYNSTDENYMVLPDGNAPYAYYYLDDIVLMPLSNSVFIEADEEICEGETASLSAFGNSSFNWATADNPGLIFSTEQDIEVSPLQTTSYFLYGDADTATVTVSVLQAPNVELGTDLVICVGQSYTLTPISNASNFVWSDGSTDNELVIDGPGEYWVDGFNGPCETSDTIVVTTAIGPAVELGNDLTLCEGETFTMDVTTSEAFGYLWQDGSTDPAYTVTEAGTYTVELLGEDCVSSDEITIDFEAAIALDLGDDFVLCNDETATLDAFDPAALSYQWQDGSNTNIFNVQEPGLYSVTVSTAICDFTDEVMVSYELPETDLGPNVTLCEDETATFNMTTPNAISYIWQDGTDSPTYTVSEAGVYSVLVSSENCNFTDEVLVDYELLPFSDLGDDFSLCEEETATLDVSVGGAAYLWQNGSTNSTFEVTEEGQYSVEIMGDVCSEFDSINITYDAPPIINIGEDTLICEGDVIPVNANTSNATYWWSNNSASPGIDIDEAGLYWVEVTQNACVVYDSIQVETIACECPAYIPNTFSPDFDGFNDYFEIYAPCAKLAFDFKIFNRWGALVFETNNPEDKWDGRFKGKPAQAGVYVYYVSIVFDNLKTTELFEQGSVTLVR